MLKRFTTKQLTFIALMGALIFVIAFSISVGFNIVTGTPMVGGIVANLIVVSLWVITVLVIRKFGTGILLGLIHTILSTPTANFGLPGFYKIFIGLFIGLFIDVVLYIGNYKKIAYYIGIGLGVASAIPLMFFALTLLGVPEAEKISKILISATAIYLVESLIAVWIGFKLYNKIKNKRVIQQISD